LGAARPWPRLPGRVPFSERHGGGISSIFYIPVSALNS
jgi:hypothetical protein